MRLHRFISTFDFTPAILKIHDPALVYQLLRVLRFQIGDEIILCDGACGEARVRILDIQKNIVDVEIIERMQNNREPITKVVLYVAMLKNEHFELVAQKATEIGVSEIVPVISERTVKLHLNETRMRTIIKEAAEQSGRGVVPLLYPSLSFDEMVQSVHTNDITLFFDPSGEPFSKEMITSDKKRIGVCIGPEGGWTEGEVQMTKDKGLVVVSLGSRILRAETAAIVASGLILL